MESYWIAVVDDDVTNLKAAGHILARAGMRASVLRSGHDLFEFLRVKRPDLILLDVHMPVMDGFEALGRLRHNEAYRSIPVIFLTADDDAALESQGLAAGAMDFIKKPFVPEVLLLRVRNTIELVRLQTDLSAEVERKTRELTENQQRLARIAMQVVQALSGAIDAKDSYTNGHSLRVAQYSREIARRAGQDGTAQDVIYMMGLLHDIGKIGIPDSIINKQSRLTDEEFAVIKRHPVLGARILQNIEDFPELATGAHWHHERFDGRGYPDGLAGEDIPREARIIAVADAYDAMTSYRSYRDVLPQQAVRAEIARNRGTQFDPAFADIMLEMIDGDLGYAMRERR